MIRLIFRPLPAWIDPVTPDRDRQLSRFSTTWINTVNDLRREVGYVAARTDTELILQVQADNRAFRNDGWIRADAKVREPGVVISFESKYGPLRYACDTFRGTGYGGWLPDWQANVRAIGLGLEALRKVDRYGIARSGEQYTGFSALSPGAPLGEPGGVVIELHDVDGIVVAEAIVDAIDVDQALHRWYRLANGYVVRTLVNDDGKSMRYLHRDVMGLSLGDGLQVDHIDGDRLNNRRANLRVVSQAVNSQNRGPNAGRDLPRNVYFVPRRGKYRAQTKIDGRAVHLGDFDTVDEADAAASRWRAEHMPGSADAREYHVDSMTVDEAVELLGRWRTHPTEWIDDAIRRNVRGCVDVLYRRAAKQLHPDVGGDPDDFKRVAMARNLLAFL